MHVSWRKRLSRRIRGELRAALLGAYGDGILARTKNGLLIVDPRDFSVSRTLLERGAYGWQDIQWLGSVLNDRSSIVFVGAHIGSLLIPIARHSGSRRIVALEPSPRNHRLLKMNIALNGLDFVEIHQLAAGAGAGQVRFTENQINSGNSRVAPAGEVEIRVERLDTVLPGNDVIDLIVMDTEGFEVQAMRGAEATLKRTRYFHVEFAPEQLREQGTAAQEFIDIVSARFNSMYLAGEPLEFFPNRSYVPYLRNLPERKGLLLNLLFSDDPTARSELARGN